MENFNTKRFSSSGKIKFQISTEDEKEAKHVDQNFTCLFQTC